MASDPTEPMRPADLQSSTAMTTVTAGSLKRVGQQAAALADKAIRLGGTGGRKGGRKTAPAQDHPQIATFEDAPEALAETVPTVAMPMAAESAETFAQSVSAFEPMVLAPVAADYAAEPPALAADDVAQTPAEAVLPAMEAVQGAVETVLDRGRASSAMPEAARPAVAASAAGSSLLQLNARLSDAVRSSIEESFSHLNS